MISQLELGPHVRHLGFIVKWTVFKFHLHLIIASEALQPFQETSESWQVKRRPSSFKLKTAKYVWRLSFAWHKFYKLNQYSLQTQKVPVNPVRRRVCPNLTSTLFVPTPAEL